MNKKLNKNPTQSEETEEHIKAHQELTKLYNNPTERTKVPLWINSTTTIFVDPEKATEEYRQQYILKMNKAHAAYER